MDSDCDRAGGRVSVTIVGSDSDGIRSDACAVVGRWERNSGNTAVVTLGSDEIGLDESESSPNERP